MPETQAQKQWSVRAAFEWICSYLTRKGDEHPRLSAEWLLGAAGGWSRVEVYTHFDCPLNAQELAVLHDAVLRRGKGEPLQYVTGEMPFRHIVLKCAPGVLIPRPETEVLVDCVLEYIRETQDVRTACAAAPSGQGPAPQVSETRVLEVGCGTGCIALSLALESAGTRVVTTDISAEAVSLARRNASALGCCDAVEIIECDLVEGVVGAREHAFDVLVSNPPYIPSGLLEHLPREVVGFEPRTALDGGADGLDIFRRLLALAPDALRPRGLFACELYEECLETARDLVGLQGAFDNVRIVRDLAGRERILTATRKEMP